jgi:hypothetical protein
LRKFGKFGKFGGNIFKNHNIGPRSSQTVRSCNRKTVCKFCKNLENLAEIFLKIITSVPVLRRRFAVRASGKPDRTSPCRQRIGRRSQWRIFRKLCLINSIAILIKVYLGIYTNSGSVLYVELAVNT